MLIRPQGIPLRTGNHFVFVDTGTLEMVPLTPQAISRGVDLLAIVSTLCGGARNATRAWLGYTPLWKTESDQEVWWMKCTYVRVPRIKTIHLGAEMVMRRR